MNFFDAIKSCFRQYATFTGRASRPEFWWFALFCVLVTMAAGVIHPRANALASLLLLLPALAVAARRLHDIDRSGWWQLVNMVPLVGWLVVLYWYVQPSQAHPNRFGPPPAQAPDLLA